MKLMMKYISSSLLCLAALASCTSEDTLPSGDLPQGEELSLTVYIDKEEATRTLPGDPTPVQYPLPSVLMAYMSRPISNEQYDSIAYYVLNIGEGNWSEEPYYKTINGVQTLLYRYMRTVNITMPTFSNVRLYCILATDTLTFLPGSEASKFPYVLPPARHIKEDSIKNLICDRDKLDHMLLYNLFSGWSALSTISGSITCRIVASHVASKIDLIYNVADSLIAALPTSSGLYDLQVTSLVLKNTTRNGYFFKKRSNTLAACGKYPDVSLYNLSTLNGNSYSARFYEYAFLRDFDENNHSATPTSFVLTASDNLHAGSFTYNLPLSLPATRTVNTDSVRLLEQSAYVRYDVTIGGEKSGTYTLTKSSLQP